jgi:protein gp37
VADAGLQGYRRQEWVLNIKRQCDEQSSAFFFKQWRGWGVDGKKRAKKENGWMLQGRAWDAVPLASTPRPNVLKFEIAGS